MNVNNLSDKILLITRDLIGDEVGKNITYADIKDEYQQWRGITDEPRLAKEMKYLLLDYLKPEGYIQTIGPNSTQAASVRYLITPKGYSYIHDLMAQKIASNNVFCAMWFDNCMGPTWEMAIKPAIKNVGYTAVRIDEVHHNNDINAEIILKINQSKFIVADFTGNRGGVYFEAGYAKGKNIPVIYTCKKDSFEKEKPHFDVEHYLFILWESEGLETFKKTLQDRIVNTIPEDPPHN